MELALELCVLVPLVVPVVDALADGDEECVVEAVVVNEEMAVVEREVVACQLAS